MSLKNLGVEEMVFADSLSFHNFTDRICADGRVEQKFRNNKCGVCLSTVLLS